MSRRFHKKSKTGCVECKRRHVKCDESRPACVNCLTAELRCSFLDRKSPSIATGLQSRETTSTEPCQDSSGTEDQVTPDGTVQHRVDEFDVNMDHLELLHHFQTETCTSLGNPKADFEIPHQMIFRCALSTPYLMHEMLAISALHLSTVHPAQQAFRRHQATGFQTKALALFNSAQPEVNESTSVAMFLFSSFLGIQVLCETIALRDDNLSTFWDRFTNYLNLHRGVRIIASHSWQLLKQTELGPYLNAAEALHQRREGIGSECDGLKVLIESSDIGPKSSEAYQIAIEHLQRLFDAQRQAGGAEDSARLLFAWPVIVPLEYTNLLSQQRPQALIILAYYAVILHGHRWLWVIGDGGRFLIELITKTLDKHWDMWLVWPNTVLNASSPAQIQIGTS